MKKIIKKILLTLLILLVILVVLILPTFVSFDIQMNQKSFALESKYAQEVSTYPKNGSDWGHNQTKLDSIGDTVFMFDFDNANLENGNSSGSNVYTASFFSLSDGKRTEIGVYSCNRPGNVLTDSIHNKVYLILVEPVGNAYDDAYVDFTNTSISVMYEFNYDSSTTNCTFVKKHEITPVSSDGKIRQGVDMDEDGNIAIGYGTYDGYMVIETYNFAEGSWQEQRYLSNYDGDSLMYCSVAMKDLNHVYLLAEQDSTINGHTYYQYVMFFLFEDGIWSSEIVCDYRNHELASTEDALVLSSDIEYFNGEVHMIACARKFHEVTYLVYDGVSLEKQNTDYLINQTLNAHFFIFDDALYLTTMSLKYRVFFPTFSVFDISEEKLVYQMTSVLANNYFYIGTDDHSLYLLIYTDNHGKLYQFEKK